MSTVLTNTLDNCSIITLNRTEKHNAFDEEMIETLTKAIDAASTDPSTNCIILKANGKNFCAGADLNWMKKMAAFSFDENYKDALTLAKLLKTLYDSPKVTIALAQGKALGGGAGLICACDFVLASENAAFAFTEIHLGLIPAVISPYVIESIGPKATKKLFLNGQLINAKRAKDIELIDEIILEQNLLEAALKFAKSFSSHDNETIKACKALLTEVNHHPIDDELSQKTAKHIALVRQSQSAKRRISAFLDKQS